MRLQFIISPGKCFFLEGETASLIRETETGIVRTRNDAKGTIMLITDVMAKRPMEQPEWYNPD